jgi:acetyltransferase
MINRQLLRPESIVVVGGSNNTHKPGGAVVRNLLNGGYKGVLRVVNPKEDEVQGVKVYHDVKEIPPTDLAVVVIPAKFCPDTVRVLASEKGVKAFIKTERARAAFGFPQKSGRKVSTNRKLILMRHRLAKDGYIVIKGSRIVYYSYEIKRHYQREKNAMSLGLVFELWNAPLYE